MNGKAVKYTIRNSKPEVIFLSVVLLLAVATALFLLFPSVPVPFKLQYALIGTLVILILAVINVFSQLFAWYRRNIGYVERSDRV